ncbi:unnamed protein product, partial [Choristocarpus tenellus]
MTSLGAPTLSWRNIHIGDTNMTSSGKGTETRSFMDESELPFRKGERVIVVDDDGDGSGNKIYRAATIIMVSFRSVKRQLVPAFKVYYAGTARGLADEFVELGRMLKTTEETLLLKKEYEDRVGIKAPGRQVHPSLTPAPVAVPTVAKPDRSSAPAPDSSAMPPPAQVQGSGAAVASTGMKPSSSVSQPTTSSSR